MDIFGEGTTDEVYTFCKRELIQVIWKLLLDGNFIHAYEHGIVIHCNDGVTRRIFPRFLRIPQITPKSLSDHFLSHFRALICFLQSPRNYQVSGPVSVPTLSHQEIRCSQDGYQARYEAPYDSTSGG
jgi:hypothetical protein